jgi:isopentenyl diphosphate isomerase/L-lactate dehydrogenase-like FMN-dependent dehydrogenase
VNVLEYEEVARQTLPADVLAGVAGSDRTAFDRITLRPRMLIPTLDLDLSVELFGETHLAPILVGPIADQRRYHAEGELATVRGASAGKAAAIVSNRSSVPIGDLVAQATTPVWYSVYGDAAPAAQKQVEQAVAAGCKAVCVTIGASPNAARSPSATRIDWKALAEIRRDVKVPFLVKGVMTTDEARRAIDLGAQGIVVSNHGGTNAPAPIEVLPAIADAVAGKATLLVDGSFRRGADILKALILGAHAVVVARPVIWGLAAYGAAGVQGVIEMLQSDLGRHMGALGTPNLKSLNRNFVRIHRR